MRERIYSPDRLKYPMKRIGKRGEGKFERISWEEAVKTIASEWKRIRDAYGNESIYWQYCSGQQSIVSSRRAWQRLMNLMGGFLKYYGSYSNAQLAAAFPLTYGGRPASLPSVIADAELYVLFGNNPSVTRPSGGGKGYQIDLALSKKRPKIIVIDPCFTDTATTRADEWVPIRPGTDAALVEALAYEWITKNQVDQAFLDKYCVGYDEKTLPASAPKNADYKSHILGRGPDRKDAGMGERHYGNPCRRDPASCEGNGRNEAALRLARLGPAASGERRRYVARHRHGADSPRPDRAPRHEFGRA